MSTPKKLDSAPLADKPINIKPDHGKAVAALKRIRPKGLIRLGAIKPDSGAPMCKTFHLATEAHAAREWMDAHQKQGHNLHFEAGVPKGRKDRKSSEADIGFVQYQYVDCDPLPGESAC